MHADNKNANKFDFHIIHTYILYMKSHVGLLHTEVGASEYYRLVNSPPDQPPPSRNKKATTTTSASMNRCVFRCRFAPCKRQFRSWYVLKQHFRAAHAGRYTVSTRDDPQDFAVVKSYHSCRICSKQLLFDSRFIYAHVTVILYLKEQELLAL